MHEKEKMEIINFLLKRFLLDHGFLLKSLDFPLLELNFLIKLLNLALEHQLFSFALDLSGLQNLNSLFVHIFPVFILQMLDHADILLLKLSFQLGVLLSEVCQL